MKGRLTNQWGKVSQSHLDIHLSIVPWIFVSRQLHPSIQRTPIPTRKIPLVLLMGCINDFLGLGGADGILWFGLSMKRIDCPQSYQWHPGSSVSQACNKRSGEGEVFTDFFSKIGKSALIWRKSAMIVVIHGYNFSFKMKFLRVSE